MTKKDSELIANQLKVARAGHTHEHQLMGFDSAIVSVANALLKSNPRFDSQRFLQAAGFNINDWMDNAS